MWDGDEEERLRDAQAAARDDALEQAAIPTLLDNVAERLEEALGGQALGSCRLRLNAHDLKRLIPCGKSASDGAAQSLFPQGQLDIFGGFVRTNVTFLHPTARRVSKSLS